MLAWYTFTYSYTEKRNQGDFRKTFADFIFSEAYHTVQYSSLYSYIEMSNYSPQDLPTKPWVWSLGRWS